MTDTVRVGTCAEHAWAGAHVLDTYEIGDGSEHCRDFVDIPNFAHEPTEFGNAFGGHKCTCGEPWLTRGCMTGASHDAES